MTDAERNESKREKPVSILDWPGELARLVERAEKAEAECIALRAQLAAAQADTERLDWLGENWWKFRSMPTGRDLRECIDAARAASHKESRDE